MTRAMRASKSGGRIHSGAGLEGWAGIVEEEGSAGRAWGAEEVIMVMVDGGLG